MKIVSVPCLSDNYAYLVICEDTGQAGIVDPSEAAPVIEQITSQGVTLVAILNTHHHWDHIGGNNELLAKYSNLKVYGHATDKGRIDGQTEFLNTGDAFTLGNLEFHAIHNPGHTSGAVSYTVEDAVFTGDTMFAGGCGRLFEGTPANMHESLTKAIGSLPKETRVFFGHEYTEGNLEFASFVEPDNQDVKNRLASVKALRAKGTFTTPSTLAEEWKTNPFMRSDSAAIQSKVKNANPSSDLSPVSVLGAVRKMKDNY